MMTVAVSLISVNVGQPRTMEGPNSDDPRQRVWHSGIFKLPVQGPVRVGKLNLAGDGQGDTRVHGGVDKAVLAYSADHYPHWNHELAKVFDARVDLLSEAPMGPGAFGENLTFTGINEETVCLGDLWQIGDVLLQVSQPRQPCWKLARRWKWPQLPKRVVQTGRSGWYLRVHREGTVVAGLPCQLVDRPHPCWSIARVNRALFERSFPSADACELAGIPELSESWKKDLIATIKLPGRR